MERNCSCSKPTALRVEVLWVFLIRLERRCGAWIMLCRWLFRISQLRCSMWEARVFFIIRLLVRLFLFIYLFILLSSFLIILILYFIYFPYYPAPPTNQSTYRQWTIGPIYYSAIVTAEALGPSNTTQVVDLLPNNANIYTPAYSIYEGGTLARMLLFNYVSDPSGASDLTVQLNLSGGGGGSESGPSQVYVKYLQASSVSQKGNFTWAGQV